MANSSPLYDGSNRPKIKPAFELVSGDRSPRQSYSEAQHLEHTYTTSQHPQPNHPALLPYPDLGVGVSLALATRQHCTCACQLGLPYLPLPTLTKL